MLIVARWVIDWWSRHYDEGVYVMDHLNEQTWFMKKKWQVMIWIFKAMSSALGYRDSYEDFIMDCTNKEEAN